MCATDTRSIVKGASECDSCEKGAICRHGEKKSCDSNLGMQKYYSYLIF